MKIVAKENFTSLINACIDSISVYSEKYPLDELRVLEVLHHEIKHKKQSNYSQASSDVINSLITHTQEKNQLFPQSSSPATPSYIRKLFLLSTNVYFWHNDKECEYLFNNIFPKDVEDKNSYIKEMSSISLNMLELKISAIKESESYKTCIAQQESEKYEYLIDWGKIDELLVRRDEADKHSSPTTQNPEIINLSPSPTTQTPEITNLSSGRQQNHIGMETRAMKRQRLTQEEKSSQQSLL